MAASKTRTGITLGVLAATFLVMLIWGWQAASKPFPKVGEPVVKCKKYAEKKVIFRREIRVSVYNGSKREGLADRTMSELENRRFLPGDVGNANAASQRTPVVIRTGKQDDPYARLVAAQFNPGKAAIRVTENDLGPGIDIVLGPKFKKFRPNAPKSLRLKEPIRTCLDAPSGS